MLLLCKINRVADRIFYIYFSATDSAGSPDTGTQTFTLSVTNVDEAPVFTLSSLTVKLATAAAGKYIFTQAMKWKHTLVP